VEDDPAIRETTVLLLESFGFSVREAPDGQTGIDAFRRERPDVALLDVMLPRIDGISLTRLIRAESDVPVVLLSARGENADIVSGLEAGADDYLTKPFDGPVLAARLHAVLRRIRRGAAASQPDTLEAGGLSIDLGGLTVQVDGAPVRLTMTEVKLAIELVLHAGIVLDRDTLLQRVWDYPAGGDTRLVDVHIQRLRAKIGAARIVTVRGAGYKLER
jgi:DNA-binding response OmpR family regulator